MYILYDKKTGFARVTGTENPIMSCKLVPNWYENYILEEFPYTDMIYLNEHFLKVENNKIKVIGRIDELMNKKLQYRYDGFSPLFEGE
jgi:hypothetical protein